MKQEKINRSKQVRKKEGKQEIEELNTEKIREKGEELKNKIDEVINKIDETLKNNEG